MVSQDEIGITHRCGVIACEDKSICYIVDENETKQSHYNEFHDNSNLECSIGVEYFFNVNHDLVGILLNIKIRSRDDKFEYVIEPSDEFISCILDTSEIYFISKSGKIMFEMRKIDVSAIQRYNAQYC